MNKAARYSASPKYDRGAGRVGDIAAGEEHQTSDDADGDHGRRASDRERQDTEVLHYEQPGPAGQDDKMFRSVPVHGFAATDSPETTDTASRNSSSATAPTPSRRRTVLRDLREKRRPFARGWTLRIDGESQQHQHGNKNAQHGEVSATTDDQPELEGAAIYSPGGRAGPPPEQSRVGRTHSSTSKPSPVQSDEHLLEIGLLDDDLTDRNTCLHQSLGQILTRRAVNVRDDAVLADLGLACQLRRSTSAAVMGSDVSTRTLVIDAARRAPSEPENTRRP